MAKASNKGFLGGLILDNKTSLTKKRLNEIYEEDWAMEGANEPAIPNYSDSYAQKRMRIATQGLIAKELKRKKKGSMLDVGTGNGLNCFMLNDLLGYDPNYKLVGSEISKSAVSRANSIARKWGRGNLKFVAGDAEKLPFADDSFDSVLCTEVIEHLPRPQIAIDEMFRVLKPGGLAVISTPNENHALKKFLPASFKKKAHDEQSEWANRYEKHAEFFQDRKELHISVQTKSELTQKMEKAGFTRIKFHRQSLFFGGMFYDKHSLIFALSIFADKVLDLFGAITWSWDFVASGRKPRG